MFWVSCCRMHLKIWKTELDSKRINAATLSCQIIPPAVGVNGCIKNRWVWQVFLMLIKFAQSYVFGVWRALELDMKKIIVSQIILYTGTIVARTPEEHQQNKRSKKVSFWQTFIWNKHPQENNYSVGLVETTHDLILLHKCIDITKYRNMYLVEHWMWRAVHLYISFSLYNIKVVTKQF